MIDKATLNSLIACKRNNIVNILHHLKSHEGNETDRNIDAILKGYQKATNDMLEGKVKDNLFSDFNYYSSDVEKIGYAEAVTTIMGVVAWEKSRENEDKKVEGDKALNEDFCDEFIRRLQKKRRSQDFESICDTFDKIFYKKRGE